MAYYVGVDLGATNVRAVVGDAGATELGRARDATPQGPTGIAVTEAVLSVVREACDDAGVAPSDVAAAGVGSIGPFDMAAGVVDGPANLPDTVGRIPITGPLSELLGTDDVHLHNDTNAGVIGERFHSERNPDDMAYLTISSGIGAGVTVDGSILSGWDGNAGEVGHMTLDPNGLMTCGCGLEGHWEAYCSGDNIPRYARELHAEDPVDTAVPVDDPGFSAKDIFDNAGEDRFADYVIDQLAHWNAMGIANVIHAYAPLVVTVGGAVALNNPDLILDPVRDQLEEMLFVNSPEIHLTDFGDDVVLQGALASALTNGTGDRSRL